VRNSGLEQMLRSLVMRHHPDSLMEAAAAGDTDVVSTMLEHLPPLPNVGRPLSAVECCNHS